MAETPTPTPPDDDALRSPEAPSPRATPPAVAFRSAITGRFVTAAEAARSPHTHVRHVLRPRP